MTDDPVTVPDFVPTSIEEQHREMARQQVRDSRSPQPVPPAPHAVAPPEAAVRTRPAAQEVQDVHEATDARPSPRWLGRLSGAELALATAAAIVGLLGVTALTTFWAWLGMSGDPMWWGFTAVGFVVSLGLALAVAALNQHAQTRTAVTVPSD